MAEDKEDKDKDKTKRGEVETIIMIKEEAIKDHIKTMKKEGE